MSLPAAGGGEEDAHRNLMVNFLPSSWTSTEMRAFFQQFGEMEECKVIMDKATGTSKGYGFVKFVSRLDAESALTQAQGMQVEGKQLKIQKAAAGKVPSGPVSLYIAGFNPATFGMNELQQLLAPYGSVVSVKVHPSQPGKKGVAFIGMDSWTAANAAAEALNGVNYGEDRLVIRVAQASVKQATEAGLEVGAAGGRARPGLGGNRFQPYSRPGQVATQAMMPQAQAPFMVIANPMAQMGLPQLPQLQYSMAMPQMQYVYPTAGLQVEPTAALAAGMAAPAPGDGGYSLFVYGVRGMDEQFLLKLFSQFGTISSAQAPAGKNYGFVKMPNFAEAQNAVNTLNGCMLQGATVPLQVSFKDNKAPTK